MSIKVEIQENDFCATKLQDWVLKHSNNSGAYASFIGRVRQQGNAEDRVRSLHLSTYHPLAIKQAEQIAQTAKQRFNIDAVCIVHRYGKLKPNEQIVLVTCASKHRKAAFNAVDFIMDYLKSDVAFWKKEITEQQPDGKWIEPTQDDKKAINSW